MILILIVGVDSIMGIDIASGVNSQMGLDVLVPSFVLEYLTIADLRAAFTDSLTDNPPNKSESEFSMIDTPSETTKSTDVAPAENNTAGMDEQDDMVIIDDSPLPIARITLIQGRRSSGKQAFYLIADGTGSIATYIHLPQFQSRRPIYAIDSPFLHCPGELTARGGIPAAARSISEALIKSQPEGPLSLGGFSGGAMVSYEVCRQLASAGRTVSSLLLIDMCCPRPIGSEDKVEVGWKVYESIATSDGLWDSTGNTEQHLKATFASVAMYHPPPMTEQERPLRTAIIWARKGLIDRCSKDKKVIQSLADNGIATKAYPGFMEDGKVGAVMWGLPHKTAEDLGPNGWDRFVGEMLCLSIDADHLEMPMPSHVHLLHGAMEEAFAYFGANE